jgi:hypothetical protein
MGNFREWRVDAFPVSKSATGLANGGETWRGPSSTLFPLLHATIGEVLRNTAVSCRSIKKPYFVNQLFSRTECGLNFGGPFTHDLVSRR